MTAPSPPIDMSLLDYFAGQALPAIIANLPERITITDIFDQTRAGAHEARMAYAYATAMLAERRKHATYSAPDQPAQAVPSADSAEPSGGDRSENEDGAASAGDGSIEAYEQRMNVLSEKAMNDDQP